MHSLSLPRVFLNQKSSLLDYCHPLCIVIILSKLYIPRSLIMRKLSIIANINSTKYPYVSRSLKTNHSLFMMPWFSIIFLSFVYESFIIYSAFFEILNHWYTILLLFQNLRKYELFQNPASFQGLLAFEVFLVSKRLRSTDGLENRCCRLFNARSNFV